METEHIEVKIEPEEVNIQPDHSMNAEQMIEDTTKESFNNQLYMSNNENIEIKNESIYPYVEGLPALNTISDSTNSPVKVRKKRGRKPKPITQIKVQPKKKEKVIKQKRIRERLKTCFRCGKKFSESNFMKHAENCTVDRYTYCALCDKHITTGVFDKHLITHTPLEQRKRFKCEICNDNFTEDGLRVHRRRMHSAEKWQYKRLLCEICGVFVNQTYLKAHYVSHSEEKSHICCVCGFKLKSKRRLEIHERTHKEKHLKCDLCEYRTHCKTQLKNHVNRHVGARIFHCTQCTKSFRTSAVLKVHQRIHTGERPYTCKLCPSTFYDSGNLRKHTVTVHANGKIINLKYDRQYAKEQLARSKGNQHALTDQNSIPEDNHEES